MTRFSSAAVAFIVAMTVSVLPGSVQARSMFDGRWSVTIQTLSGACDQAYRYSINIVNGNVSYDGDGSFDIRGRVANNGSVRVRVARGAQYADGVGRLYASSGAGEWRGIGGSGGACSGRWTASRRG